MANISVSLPADGETIDAADYNTPINTIVNEINGNLDNSNIDAAAAIAGTKLADSGITTAKLADEAVTYAKLLSTIFGGEVTADTNPGSAGGTRNYVDLGGIKLAWGTTASVTNNAGASTNAAITLPTSFFTTVKAGLCSIQTASGSVISNNIVGVSISTSTYTLGWANETGSNGVGGTAAWIVIGT